VNHRRIKYQSLYNYLTDWCDYTHGQANAEIQRRIAADGPYDRTRRSA
jgi:hypothetical protein